MDSTDYKILELLQKNARISMKNLGKKVGLTAPAVSDRIRKLENNNIILGYQAIVNEEKLGKKIQSLVQISMDTENRHKFYDFIDKEANIVECYHVTGSYCMIIRCLCEEMKELDALISKIQKYGETNTLMVLSVPLRRKVIL